MESSRTPDSPGPGLDSGDLAAIRRVLADFPEVTRVVLFGSRAKGCATERSDIDLAVSGNLDPLRVESIRSELEELPIPCRFDVLSFDSIRNPELREHIERVGIEVFAP